MGKHIGSDPVPGRRRVFPRGDQGASAVLVAIAVVFLVVPMAAIAVDLSNGYSNRRQMQNAADAASVAGAEQLLRVRQPGGSPSTVLDVVEDVVARNGAGRVDSCDLVSVSYPTGRVPQFAVEAPCDATSIPADVSAVRVTAGGDAQTFFARALPGGGPSSTSADGTAAAGAQRISSAGKAPFAVCSWWDSSDSKHTPWPEKDPTIKILVPSTDPPYYTINPLVVEKGYEFPIYSNGNSVSHCGNDPSFKGLICKMNNYNEGGCSFTLPEVPYAKGAQVGPTYTTVTGKLGCVPGGIPDADGEDPCRLVIPVCTSLNKAAGTLHCPVWGVVEVRWNEKGSHDGKTLFGKFLGSAPVTGGTPAPGTPGLNEPVMIGVVG